MRLVSPFFTYIIFVLIFVHVSHSLPFIVLHGIGDECSSRGTTKFTKSLSNWSGSEGYCIEVGNGFWDSWFTPIGDQAQIVCDKVKKMEKLRQGYNIVGRSQGNLIARGVIQFCEGGPPVKNYISLGGPHAGIASIPLCGSGIFCELANILIQSDAYSDPVQEHLAPSGYLKIPSNMKGYLDKCSFLPKVNNEKPGERNSTYKKRFSSLDNLILIMSEQDNVLVPKETSWFGYYPDGAYTPLLPAQKTKLYTEDWIGLKTLDDAGRVKFVKVTGGHLGISDEDMKKHMVPYLVSQKWKI
ncbi:uncharacterized protein LOC141592366 [Silene latifolia]|uniref:uncharacterized protein LOC141592366 n=1 Tax=Silene latifolia TaxID=37657 RepID=UPI003D7746CB